MADDDVPAYHPAYSRYMKTFEKVGEADGLTIEVPARSDIYTHAVLVNLNSQMADSFKARLAQTCLVLSIGQMLVFAIFFY